MCSKVKPFNQLPQLPPSAEIIDRDVLLQWGYASRNLAELNRNLLRLPDPFHTDPLIKMAISHYQFEAIHPFSDGNGRTGRILNLLYLVNQGLLVLPVLCLSKYIIENKDDYYYRLGAVTQRGVWKGWLIYMMKAEKFTSTYTNNLIDDIVNQMEATLEYRKAKI